SREPRRGAALARSRRLRAPLAPAQHADGRARARLLGGCIPACAVAAPRADRWPPPRYRARCEPLAGRLIDRARAARARRATLRRRFGAMIYDALIVLAIWLATAFIAVALNGGQAVTGPTFQSVLFVELFVFFAGFWVGRGQTVGMLAWRLHVVTTAGA